MRPHEKSIPPPQPAVLIALGTWPLTAAPQPAHLQQRRRHGRAGSARGQRRQQRKPLHGEGLGRRGVGAAVAAGQRLQRGRGRRQRGQQHGRGGALLPQRGRSRRRQVAALGRVPRAPCAARSLLARVPRALRGLRGRGRVVCGRAAAVPSPQRTVRMQSQPCLTLIPTQASAACSLVPGRAHRTCRLRARAAPAGPSAGRAARPPPGASAPRRAQSARWPALAAPASAPPPRVPAPRRARRSGLCAGAGARTSEAALDQAIRRGGSSATLRCPRSAMAAKRPLASPKHQNQTAACPA